MSFPKYPKYKISGVEWLGEVPEHWEIKKTSHIAELIAGFAFPSEGFSFEPEMGIRLVRGDNVTEGYLRWGEKGRYWPFDLEYDHRYLLEPDDIVIQMDGSKVGKNWAMISENDLPALLVQRVTRVRVKTAVPRYVYSLFANELFIRYVDQAKTDPAIPHITMRNIGDYWLTIPPHYEQTAIAEFLDRETGKIDELVGEQRRLIELLKEKRQAVISHAVTKGLNPDAPMKPSGIEWLGEVPEHWTITVIKRFSTLQRGYDLTDSERTEGAYPVVTSGGVIGTHGSFMAHGPGVVTGRYGSTGRLFYIEEDFWPHNTSLYVKDFHGNNVRFVWFSLQTVDFGSHSEKAAVPGIDRNDIHVLPAVVPPKNEQQAIVEFLEAEVAKCDSLISEAEQAIELLQERRTALISAAVTGKIDVRGLVEVGDH